MRKSVAVALVGSMSMIAALGLTACGGSDSSSDGGSAPMTTEQTSGGGTAANEGQTVFVQNCGTCHTLSAAGTDGNVGPNLDTAGVDYEEVRNQVINGGGGMPAFQGVLSDAEIDAVATYVSENSGK